GPQGPPATPRAGRRAREPRRHVTPGQVPPPVADLPAGPPRAGPATAASESRPGRIALLRRRGEHGPPPRPAASPSVGVPGPRGLATPRRRPLDALGDVASTGLRAPHRH